MIEKLRRDIGLATTVDINHCYANLGEAGLGWVIMEKLKRERGRAIQR